MESLKIAIVSDWFFPKIGGIETHIDDLARNLLEIGHEPYVITHDYRYLKPYKDNFPYTVRRFSASMYLKNYHVSLGPNQLWKINELYKEVGFDITHVHSIYSPLSIAVANLSRGVRGVPVVATNHSFYGNPKVDFILGPMLRHYLRRVDSFIAVSTPVAEDTKKLLGKRLNGRPVVVVPNGIDVEKWRPPEPEEREKAREMLGLSDEIALLYIGRMTERKQAHRLPFVISSALKLSGLSKDKIRLIAVGNGAMRPKLEENLHITGLAERTVLFDFLPREKVRELYWAADVVLMPGMLEAFPIVGLEASATGRAIVGRNESGLSDLIVDGLTGFLGNSEEELSQKLAEVISNGDIIERIGREARKRAEREFSWKVVLEKLLDVYKTTLDAVDGADKRYILYRILRGSKG
ncbi:glycosyltransferase family 1 protein [Thermococcus sp. CX2]|uniref:glycosyltransferase family 4 protein n=1 Tax=Thermococcus sp. CX2 TaxID=163006 RepID=UPI00143A67F5|nr:glycosyltransferase family 4 protein [Thermococcus sp. CX2]NJE84655.1 glycosyltransferase family 1 protein [Thermococcus sp. CX2]